MKKIFRFLPLIPLFSFFSCYDFTNIETPETVSVSSDAKYQLPAGNLSFTLKDKIDVKKLREIIEKNTGELDSDGNPTKASEAAKAIEIYDYNPTQKEEAVIQYIINYPIKELSPFNSFDSDLGDFSFEKEFPIPDFNQSINDKLAIDATKAIFPEGIPGTISEINGGEPLTAWFKITAPDFKTMKLKTGALNVLVKKAKDTNPSEDFSLLVQFSLVDKTNRSHVIAKSPIVDCSKGGAIRMELADADLVPEMEILIDGTASGGTLGVLNTYDLSFSFETLNLAEITGLNMDLGEASHIDIEETIPFSGMNETFKSAKIAKGSMYFACVLPEDWSGISCKNSQFVMNGGIKIPKENFKNTTSGSDFLRQEAVLDGLEVTPNDISPAGSFIEFEVKDAHIVFHDEGDALKLSGGCRIDEVEEVILDLGAAGLDFNHSDTIDTGLNISTLLGDVLDGNDSSNLINNIKFPDIPAYLYITQPTENEALKALSLEGQVYAVYTANGEEKPEIQLAYVEGFPVKNTQVTFANIADENFMITSDELFKSENYSCKIEKMADVFNAHPDSLKLRYSVGILGDDKIIKLTNDDFQIFKNFGFKISLALVLPLQVIFDDVTDSKSGDNRDNIITIDNVLELTGNTFEDDMLKREKSSEGEDWLDYTPIIEYIALNYELDNETPLENLKVTFDLQTSQPAEAETEPEKIIEPKVLDTSDGKHELKFTNEEVEKICKTYPVMPLVKVEICDADGETPKSFTRNAHLDFKAALEIQTSGQMVKIWDKNK